jgi:putative endopeptidase
MVGKSSIARIACVLLVACATPAPQPSAQRAALGAWGIETQYLSPTVKPGDDFYRYVNEGWLATAEIPAGFSANTTFLAATLATERELESILSEIEAGPNAEGSPRQRIAALFQSYQDVPRLKERGLAPIRSDLDATLALATREQVVRAMARPFQQSIVGAGVALDPGQPRRYVVELFQAGLGLPSPEYYLLEGEPFAGFRTAYRDYIEGSFARAGIDRARERADQILALETEIARAHWLPAEMRDPVRMYHPMSPAELARFAPGFDWAAFLDEAEFGDQQTVVVNTDTALQRLAALFAKTPVTTWRSYLAFHWLDTWAPYLSEEWQQASFDFYGRTLSGIAERRPLRPRAIQFVSGSFGEEVGRAYVDRYFPPAYRAQLDQMIGYMRSAYRERLTHLEWMDEATRTEAIAKLDQIITQIGYPEHWRDYSSVQLAPDDLVGNVRRIEAFERGDARAKLAGPRRDWEWPWSPQTVNAAYLPERNTVNFPAAFLQPPFFDPFADPAVNFGATAAVIGHEVGHAFDDAGSRSDGEGRLRNWWTPASRAQFEQRTARLIAQFGEFSPLEGRKLNGELTLGENIGDLGGLGIAYDCYRRFVADQQGGRAPLIDGFTGDQRFFLSWAQVWRNLVTPDEARERLLTDPHSPGEFRVNGVVRNVDAWYTAFGVGPADALYLAPSERVRIW